MGEVYELFDHHLGMRVAGKTVRDQGGMVLYRLKHEFRLLADIQHHNLVRLYELVCEADQWFFTMELVDGVPFTDFASVTAPDSLRDAVTLVDPGEPSGSSSVPQPQQSVQIHRYDSLKLREALQQLCLGLDALHGRGMLHRDIKPSNVLVEPDGRVVILDFGLTTDTRHARGEVDLLEGTPGYISPEQVSGDSVTPASDWYAVGTMLYQVLTGRLPFFGNPLAVAYAKTERDPPPPVQVNPLVEADLNQLCVELMSRVPHQRPGAEEVIRRLGAHIPARVAQEPAQPFFDVTQELFFGREPELSELKASWEQVLAGKQALVILEGPSGIGKSALARHFIEHLQQPEAVVLIGRCYGRESVPYNAFDAIVDDLSHAVATLDEQTAQSVIPADIAHLMRLFPVLRRIWQVHQGHHQQPPLADLHELRQRAFGALRQMLSLLAVHRRVMLFIDDLQWADSDSLALLDTLTGREEPPPVFLAATFRSEERFSFRPLEKLLNRARGHTRRIQLGPLSASETAWLAESLLVGSSGLEPGILPQLARLVERESQGNPFLAGEIARYFSAVKKAEQTMEEEEIRGLSYEDVMQYRLGVLSGQGKLILKLVALAAGPIAQSVIAQAAGMTISDEIWRDSISQLAAQGIIRRRGLRGPDKVETYHDRIREALLGSLAAQDQQELHHKLAVALETHGDVQADQLAHHWIGAANHRRAATHLLRAAAEAKEKLAFKRAADLYGMAVTLELDVDAGPSRLEVLQLHGDALAAAGYGKQAAAAYQEAAGLCSGQQQSQLLRQTAEQFLRAGYIDKGAQVLDQVLRSYGIALPRSQRWALASLVLRRVAARVRLRRFRPRPADRIAQHLLDQADLYSMIGTTYALLDHLCGAVFHARGLQLSFKLGEATRYCRSLASEAVYLAAAGGSPRRYQRLIDTARVIAAGLQDPYLDGFITGVEGVAAFQRGRWPEAYRLSDQAEQIMQSLCRIRFWELGVTQLFKLWAVVVLGNFTELRHLVATYLSSAQKRGDLFVISNICTTISNVVWLADDDVQTARQMAEIAILQWQQRGFFMQHFFDQLALGNIDLYCGDCERTLERLDRSWRDIRRSMLLNLPYVRIMLYDLRARAALACAAQDRQRRDRLHQAARDCRRLGRQRGRWAHALSSMIGGQLAALEGDHRRARVELERAADGFDACSMAMHAAAARQHLARLLGGDAGQQLQQQATAYWEAQTISDPKRMMAMIAPVEVGG